MQRSHAKVERRFALSVDPRFALSDERRFALSSADSSISDAKMTASKLAGPYIDFLE